MSKADSHKNEDRVYRVDKFMVPSTARDEFMQKVGTTHELLRTLPGFIQDFVLEKTTGESEFNVVTIVIWENLATLEAAKPKVAARHAEFGFSPQELFSRLGIKADLATYQQVDA